MWPGAQIFVTSLLARGHKYCMACPGYILSTLLGFYSLAQLHPPPTCDINMASFQVTGVFCQSAIESAQSDHAADSETMAEQNILFFFNLQESCSM